MHLLLPMLGLQVPARWQSEKFFKTVNIRQNLKRSIMYWFWQRSTSFRFSIWQPWGWIQVRQEDEKKMMIIIDKEAGLIPVLRRERLAVGWGRRFVPSRGPTGSRQGAGGTSSDNLSCSADVLVRACCTPATKVPRSDLVRVAFCAASNPPQSQRPLAGCTIRWGILGRATPSDSSAGFYPFCDSCRKSRKCLTGPGLGRKSPPGPEPVSPVCCYAPKQNQGQKVNLLPELWRLTKKSCLVVCCITPRTWHIEPMLLLYNTWKIKSFKQCFSNIE